MPYSYSIISVTVFNFYDVNVLIAINRLALSTYIDDNYRVNSKDILLLLFFCADFVDII